MGILDGNSCVSTGEIWVENKSLRQLSAKERRLLCGTILGFVPQNPMTAFDPRLKLKRQMVETLCLRTGLGKAAALSQAQELLLSLGLTQPERVLDAYPSQLSGGMLQRVAAALLIALKPQYILADEPTSALDAQNRTLLLTLLAEQKLQAGILLISHDVQALTDLCEIVHVMVCGRLVEAAPMLDLLTNPQQEWTKTFAAAYQPVRKEQWVWTD